MPSTITLEAVRAIAVCEPQVELFEQVFGSGAALTRANLKLAGRSGLDLIWWAERTIPAEAMAAFRERVGAARADLHRTVEGLEATHRVEREQVIHLGGGSAFRPSQEERHAAHQRRLADAQADHGAALGDILADTLGIEE